MLPAADINRCVPWRRTKELPILDSVTVGYVQRHSTVRHCRQETRLIKQWLIGQELKRHKCLTL